MKDVVKKFPLTTYVVLGATANVIKKYGEVGILLRSSEKYSLEGNVMFINRFVDYDRLLEFLLMSDIYIVSLLKIGNRWYPALYYAVACGKAVVSTPYWYAEELLDDNTGHLVPFKDPGNKQNAETSLSDETARNRLRKNAYDKGEWYEQVALDYFNVFGRAVTV
jgi:glycosyltransferase involved in cell wall biosynthesis